MRSRKAQLRRSVSLSPRVFLTLEAWSKATGEPMTALAEFALLAAARNSGVDIPELEEARAEMRQRADRVIREKQRSVEQMRREAFEC